MIVKNRRRVDFYTHVAATTAEDSSSRRRIWRYGKRSFPSMRTASFRGLFLLPAAVVEVAVAICLNSLFSSVIPASGTGITDKTFINGLLTIQDQELFKSHNKRKPRQQYLNHASMGIKRLLWLSVFTTLEPPYWMFSRISEAGPNRKLVPSTSRLSFWTV